MQRTWKILVHAVLVAICTWLGASHASAQALAVQGNRFTVNGNAKFLVFVTYFDALDVPAAQLETDFGNLKHAVHVDGIRILPNWFSQTSRTSARTNSPNTVMDENGNIRPGPWNQFLYVLDRARAWGLVVDVSWTAETVGPAGTTFATLSYGNYRAALGTITSAMASPRFNHVMFDLQNESNQNGPQRVPLDDGAARDLAVFVHQRDPNRIVTVSVDQNRTPDQARQRADDTDQNVVSWHEKRIPEWYLTTNDDVHRLRASGKPAYLQEPPKFEDSQNQFPPATATTFLRAAQEAKIAGAAAWCYHTSAGQWMDGGTGSNPNGGIWDRMTAVTPDSSGIDNGLIANLSPRLGDVNWGIDDGPGPGPGPGPGIVAYEHINFSGAALPISGTMDFVGWEWNDRISSIRIPPGRTVILYQDWFFGGISIPLTGDIADLRNVNWNDFASSIRVQ